MHNDYLPNRAGQQAKKLDELAQRQRELQRLVAKAVETGEPVFVGVWGPTGQPLYLSAKPKAARAGTA